MIVATGLNRITEVFAFVGRALSFGYNALCDILDAVGLPYEVYFMIIIGFFVVYFVVGSVRDYWLGSADSALSDVARYNRRASAAQASQERFERNLAERQKNREAFEARTEFYRERNKEIFASLRRRGKF